MFIYNTLQKSIGKLPVHVSFRYTSQEFIGRIIGLSYIHPAPVGINIFQSIVEQIHSYHV